VAGSLTPPLRSARFCRDGGAPRFEADRPTTAEAEEIMTRSRTLTAGLVICALLGIADILGLAGLGADGAPPAAIVIGGAVLGLITLVGVRLAWRARHGGILAVVVSRLLSALLGIPAFFIDDAPDWARVVVGISTALTLVGVGLVLAARRQQQSSVALAGPRMEGEVDG
jgi:hypothetical protein